MHHNWIAQKWYVAVVLALQYRTKTIVQCCSASITITVEHFYSAVAQKQYYIASTRVHSIGRLSAILWSTILLFVAATILCPQQCCRRTISNRPPPMPLRTNRCLNHYRWAARKYLKRLLPSVCYQSRPLLPTTRCLNHFRKAVKKGKLWTHYQPAFQPLSDFEMWRTSTKEKVQNNFHFH